MERTKGSCGKEVICARSRLNTHFLSTYSLIIRIKSTTIQCESNSIQRESTSIQCESKSIQRELAPFQLTFIRNYISYYFIHFTIQGNGEKTLSSNLSLHIFTSNSHSIHFKSTSIQC